MRRYEKRYVSCVTCAVVLAVCASMSDSLAEEEHLPNQGTQRRSAIRTEPRVFAEEDTTGILQGLTLTITVAKKADDGTKPVSKENRFKAGVPIELVVTVKKTTGAAVHLQNTVYLLSVTDDKKKAVPRTLYGKVVLRRTENRMRHRPERFNTLSPGDSEEVNVLLTRQFDLTLDGTYYVQVSRKAIDGRLKDAVELKSNVLEIVIR